MDYLIIVCLYSRNQCLWLRKDARRPAWWHQPELRAPFFLEAGPGGVRHLAPCLIFCGLIAFTAVGAGPRTNLGDPLPGLTLDQKALFDAGKTEFLAAEKQNEGLGPVFNNTACGNCHDVPNIGGGSMI